jgi:tRNA(Ile)-lysidine synthase
MAGLRGMLPAAPLVDYRMLDLGVSDALSPDVATDGRHSDLGSFPSELAQLVIVRPLLGLVRQDVTAYCAKHALRYRFDRSNLDTTFFRNRLRHELLPVLETYNPNIRARLCNTASVAAADYALVARLKREAWTAVLKHEEPAETVVLDRDAWRALPVALQRATIREAVFRLRPRLRDVGFSHVDGACRLGLRGRPGGQAVLLGGLTLTASYHTLLIGTVGAKYPEPDQPLLSTREPLRAVVPGTNPLPGTAWVLDADLPDSWDLAEITANDDGWTAYLDYERIHGPIVMGPRRPGDVFRPRGMGGHGLKVTAYMINRKIPRHLRDRVPLVADSDGIFWVSGHQIGERVAVGIATRCVLRLRFGRAALDE